MSEVRGDYKTRFQNLSDVPMSKQPVCVALPCDVDEAVRALSGGDRSQWLRRVICEAARRELMKSDEPPAVEPVEAKPARRRRKQQ